MKELLMLAVLLAIILWVLLTIFFDERRYKRSHGLDEPFARNQNNQQEQVYYKKGA